MPPALIFYTGLFLALVVIPAKLTLVVLLFLHHERRLWHSVRPVAGSIGGMIAHRPAVVGLRKRFPR